MQRRIDMPALDLQRLQRQTSELAEHVEDPRAFRSALRQLLEETGNHAYRAGRAVLAEAPLRGYNTPQPVLRAIAAALREPAAAAPEAALTAADQLWRSRTFEEQLIAAQLLGLAAPDLPEKVLKRIERWLLDLDDYKIADGLAREGFFPLVRLNPARYLTDARGWATSPQKWARCFAVAALLPVAQDRKFEDVPAILSVLKEVMGDAEPDVRRGAVQVLRALSQRSPSEVRRFLRNQARQGGRHTARIIKRVLPGLDMV